MVSDNRKKLLTELIDDEDIRLKPYRDTVGKLTIGIGRNLDDRGISKKEAEYLANNDIDECERQLDAKIPWWRELTDARQRVLLNMCFNLGINRLLGFKKAIALIKSGNYTKASEEMLNSLWSKQVGDRSFRLAKMMREG
jgi:lysozyme